MFYLAFKFTFGNSLFCCCFFFLLSFFWQSQPDLEYGGPYAWVRWSDILCCVTLTVVWHIITYAISTNLMGAFLKNQVHLCLQFLPGGLWGQEDRLTLRSEQSSSWGLQGAALSLLEGRSPGICAWTLPHQMAFEHQLFAMPCVSSCVYQDEKDSVCLQGTQIRSRIPKASKFPLKD